MKIYTIIVTYNAMQRNWITRSIDSLSKSTIETTPVIIDNGSTDGTRNYVPEHYPNAVWMPQDKNLGFGQANNLGMKYALEHQADYILLLNQDATLAPDAIEKMLVVSDGRSLLSPLHLNGDGTRIDEMFRYSLQKSHNLMNDDLLIRHKLERCYESAEICAACWLMPIDLIKKIAFFRRFNRICNNRLAAKILEKGGLLMSEYLPGTPAAQFRYVQRNRIVAALSPSTLVTVIDLSVSSPVKFNTMLVLTDRFNSTDGLPAKPSLVAS